MKPEVAESMKPAADAAKPAAADAAGSLKPAADGALPDAAVPPATTLAAEFGQYQKLAKAQPLAALLAMLLY